MLARKLLIIALLAPVGCATLGPDAGLSELGEEVEARTGHRPVRHPDAQVEIGALLAAPLDEDRAVRLALLANPMVQAMLDTLEIGDAERVGAIRMRNPVLEFEAESGSTGPTARSFTLTQTLLDLLHAGPRRRHADAIFDAERMEVTEAMLIFIRDTRMAWVDAVAAGQLEKMAEDAVDVTDAALDFMQALHDAGNVTALDLAQARTRHENARLALATARVDRLARMEMLGTLLGDPPGWSLLPRMPNPGHESEVVDEAGHIAVERSLRLAAERQRLAALALQAGVLDAYGWVDSLKVGLTATREAGDWSRGPVVELPIPVFDTGSARKAAARARLARATHEHATTAAYIRSDARRAAAVLGHARVDVQRYLDIILPGQVEVMDQAMRQHNAMQIGVFDLLEARHGQIDAWRGYIESLNRYWTVHIELDTLLAGAGGH